MSLPLRVKVLVIRLTLRPRSENQVYSASVPRLPADRDEGFVWSLGGMALLMAITASTQSATTSVSIAESGGRLTGFSPQRRAPRDAPPRTANARDPSQRRRQILRHTRPCRTTPRPARPQRADPHQSTVLPASRASSTPDPGARADRRPRAEQNGTLAGSLRGNHHAAQRTRRAATRGP